MIFKVQQTKVEDWVKDELIRYDLKAWKEKKMMPYDIELLSNRLHETDIQKRDQHVRKCENEADHERIMERTSRSSTKVSSNTKVDSETQGQPRDLGRAAKGLLTQIDRERQVCAYNEMLARTCPSSNSLSIHSFRDWGSRRTLLVLLLVQRLVWKSIPPMLLLRAGSS